MIGVLTKEEHAQLAAAVRIADVAALEAIECEGLVSGWSACAGNNPWIDVDPMLDEREVGPRWVDLNRVILDYALQRGLIERHPKRKNVVRVTRRP